MCTGRIGSLLTAILMAVCCCCAIVGTAGTQYRSKGAGSDEVVVGSTVKTWVYLYAITTKVGDRDRETDYYDRDDFANCKSLFDKYIAAFALGLAGIALSFSAAFASFLSFCCTIMRPSVAFMAFGAAICLIVSFAISVSTYTMSQCDRSTYKELDYEIDWGLVILIIGAGVGLLGAIMSINYCCAKKTATVQVV